MLKSDELYKMKYGIILTILIVLLEISFFHFLNIAFLICMYLHFLNFSVPEANGTSHLEPSSSRKYVLILQLSPGQVAGSELLLRVLSGAWPSPSECWLHITALAYTIVSLHCSTADCAREGTASILFSVIFQVPGTQ